MPGVASPIDPIGERGKDDGPDGDGVTGKGSKRERAGRKWTVWVVVLGLLLPLLVLFVAVNYLPVQVDLLVWRARIRLAWALLAACALGVALGLLLPWRRR